jgi:hypothetical protein
MQVHAHESHTGNALQLVTYHAPSQDHLPQRSGTGSLSPEPLHSALQNFHRQLASLNDVTPASAAPVSYQPSSAPDPVSQSASDTSDLTGEDFLVRAERRLMYAKEALMSLPPGPVWTTPWSVCRF